MIIQPLLLAALAAQPIAPTTIDDRCPELAGIYLCDGGEGTPSGLQVDQGADEEGPRISFGDGAPQVRLNGRGYFAAEDGTRIGYQAVCRDARRIVLEIASTEISAATSLQIEETATGYRVDADEAGTKSTETCIRHRGHGVGTPEPTPDAP